MYLKRKVKEKDKAVQPLSDAESFPHVWWATLALSLIAGVLIFLNNIIISPTVFVLWHGGMGADL